MEPNGNIELANGKRTGTYGFSFEIAPNVWKLCLLLKYTFDLGYFTPDLLFFAGHGNSTTVIIYSFWFRLKPQ